MAGPGCANSPPEDLQGRRHQRSVRVTRRAPRGHDDRQETGGAQQVTVRSAQTGTAAVLQPLSERLERLQRERAAVERGRARLADRLDAIAIHAARRPLLDPRSAEGILG